MIYYCGKVGLRSDGDYDYKTYCIRCDSCHKDIDSDFTSFEEAVKAKRKYGVKSIKTENGWVELCSGCYKKRFRT